jgi:hypothetical protein
MTQALKHTPPPPQADEQPLPGLHRKPLTEAQRLEAVRRLQDQAEHRIKIGLDLFKAAEQHTSQHRKLLKELQEERFELYEKMQQEMTQSFNQYDQWVAQLEANVAASVERLEARIDALEAAWEQSQHRLHQTIERAEAMAAESKQLMQALEQRVVAATKAMRDKHLAKPASDTSAASNGDALVEAQVDRPFHSLTAARVPASSPQPVASLDRPPFNEGHRPATPTVTPAAPIDLQGMLAASRRRRASMQASTIELADESTEVTATLTVPEADEKPVIERLVIDVPTSHAAAIIENLDQHSASVPSAAEVAPGIAPDVSPEAMPEAQAVVDALPAISDDPCMLPPAFEAEGQSPDQADMLRAIADQVNRAAVVIRETTSDIKPLAQPTVAHDQPSVHTPKQQEAAALPSEEKYMPPTATKPANPDELKTFFIDILERLRDKP